MIEIALIGIGAFAICLAAGACVLLVVSPQRRGMLVPAMPALGAGALVLTLCLAGAFLPLNVATWCAAGLLVAVGVAGAFRHRSVRMGSRRDLAALAGASAVAAALACVVLLPLLGVGQPTMVQTGSSHDGFYYVSVADWLTGHPVFDSPDIGTEPGAFEDSPAFGPARETFGLNLRVGQESIVAGLSLLLGRSPVEFQFIAMGLWAALIPGGTVILARAVGVRSWVGLVTGAVVVLSIPFMRQAVLPNSDSVLGTALVPLLIGCVIATVRSSPSASARPPLWLTGAVLGAVVGTYTEYAPFLAALLAGVAVVGPIRSLGTRLLQALIVLGWSIALAPVIWWRAVQSTLFLLGYSSQGAPTGAGLRQSVFLQPVYDAIALWQLGPGSRVQLAAAALIGLLAIVGIIAAFVFSATRGLAVGTVLAGVVVMLVSRTATDYVLGRAVDMYTPILISTAVLGVAVTVHWLIGRARSGARRAIVGAVAGVAAVGVVVTVAFPGVRVAAAAAETVRVVGPEFQRAADWAEEGPLAVAAPVLFDQLWLSQALRSRNDVEYLSLRGDLGYRSNGDLHEYGDGLGVASVLVAPGAFVASQDAVIDRAGTFLRVDPTKTVIATPDVVNDAWDYEVVGGRALPAEGSDGILLLGSPTQVAAECLRFSGLPDGARIVLSEGGRRAEALVAGGTADVPLSSLAPSGDETEVVVSVEGAASGGFVWEGFCNR